MSTAPVADGSSGPDAKIAAFSQATESVLKDGDIMDRLKWLKRYPPIGATAVTGAVLVGVQHGSSVDALSEGGELYMPSMLVTALGTVALAKAASMVEGRRQAKKISDLTEAFTTLASLDEICTTEVYKAHRKAGGGLAVATEFNPYRSLPSEAIKGSLSELLEMTEGTAVRSFAVSADPVRHVGAMTEGMDVLEPDQWLKHIKRRSVKDEHSFKGPFLSLSRGELQKIVDSIESPQIDPYKAYLSIIKEVQPRHPVLRMTDSANEQRAERILRRTIERYLQDVKPQAEQTELVRRKIKQHILGSPYITKSGLPRVQWSTHEAGSTGETSSVYAALGVGIDTLADLPNRYKKLPKHQALRAAELGAWLALKKQIEPDSKLQVPVIQSDELPVERFAASRGLQVRIADRVLKGRKAPYDARERRGISLWPLAMRRSVLAALAIAGGFGWGNIMASQRDSYAERYFEQHMEPIYDQENKATAALPPNDPNWGKLHQRIEERYDKKIAREEQALTWQVLAKTSTVSYDYNERVKNWLTGLVAVRQYMPEEADEFARKQFRDTQSNTVGNVSPEPSEPVWHIDEFGGMSSVGYWAESASNQFYNVTGVGWENQDLDDDLYGLSRPARQKRIQALRQLPTLPLTAAKTGARKLLRVRRIISPRGEVELGDTGASVGQDAYADNEAGIDLSVPVLRGTKIVAASLGQNMALRAHQLKNGSHRLLANKWPGYDGNTPIELSYWLAPDASGQSIRAVGPIRNGDWPEAPKLRARTAEWRSRIQHATRAGGLRLQAQKDYIQANFQYRLKPLSGRAEKNVNAYVRDIFKSEKANCNTANTLLAISNPNEVNYVSGFSNNNAPNQYANGSLQLSSSERHAWAVDAKGKVWDATPSKGMTPQDKAHFVESTEPFSSPTSDRAKRLKLIVGGIGLSIAGVAAVRSRRRIASTGQRIDKQIFKLRKAGRSTAREQAAYRALNHALYAERDITDEDLYHMQTVTEYEERMTPADWDMFSRAHTPAAVKAALASSAHAVTSRAARRHIRRGQRLHKQHYRRLTT